MAAPAGIAGVIAVAEVLGVALGKVIDADQANQLLHMAVDQHMGKPEQLGRAIADDFAAERAARAAREAAARAAAPPPPAAAPPTAPAPAQPPAPGGPTP